jgi:hypothetical protein
MAPSVRIRTPATPRHSGRVFDIMRILSRRRVFRVVTVTTVLVVVIFSAWMALGFLSADVVVLASVQESRIGEPRDRVDAFVPDGHRDQYYFVNFGSLHFLKGAHPTNSLGIRLHSPALTFGIRDDKPEGRRYLLFLRYAVTLDGARVLLLNRNVRTYL